MNINQEYDYIFKFIIVGDSAVGKSSLLIRFSDNIFQESWLPTIGVDFKIRNFDINGKAVKANIWDTAGQERFKNITKVYYKGAHSAILVYDVTDRQSFENIQQWHSEVKDFAGEKVTYALVANKCDLENKRVISYDEGAQLANKLGMMFFETSAKTAEKVDQVFFDITSVLQQKYNDNSVAVKENYQKNILQKKKNDKLLNLIPIQSIKSNNCSC